MMTFFLQSEFTDRNEKVLNIPSLLLLSHTLPAALFLSWVSSDISGGLEKICFHCTIHTGFGALSTAMMISSQASEERWLQV